LVILPVVIGILFIFELFRWPQRIFNYELTYSPKKELFSFIFKAGLIILAFPAIYFITTGLPLPTSFFAKVHAVTSVPLSQASLLEHGEHVISSISRSLVLLAGLLCIGYFLSRGHKDRALVLFITMILVGYVGVKVLGGPWIGQMQRYLSPFDPLAFVGLVFLINPYMKQIESHIKKYQLLSVFLIPTITLALIGFTYSFSHIEYAVHVNNTNIAHVNVAKWLAEITRENVIIASEPIGAVGLFSNRGTVDIYGLTTKDMLGHYQDWDFTWEYLKSRGVDYLIYYPRWFPDGLSPDWLHPISSIHIQNNKIVGDDFLQVYWIEWAEFD